MGRRIIGRLNLVLALTDNLPVQYDDAADRRTATIARCLLRKANHPLNEIVVVS